MQLTGKTGQNAPFPYHYYTLPVLLLLLLGLSNTGYLAWSHYKNYTDITFSSFCAISKAVNCDTVSQSPLSILLGLPLAYWGFFAYTLFFLIFLAAVRRTNESVHLWHCLFLLGLTYAIASFYFAYISATKIKAHCILCLVSHAVSFSLCYLSWIILRRFSPLSFRTGLQQGILYVVKSLPLKSSVLVLISTGFALKLFLPPYWHWQLSTPTTTIPQGITEEGNPWIGAEQPELVIHEYADYQCFQCSKMHLFLRRLIAERPEKIRLIHHHYPMDHEFNTVVVPEPFHVGSGKMAMIAIYATSKNKFWEMNDALYAIAREKEPFNTRTLATMVSIPPGELAAATQHPQIRDFLLHEIRQGMKLGIAGTPTYVIDGKTYEGSIPAEILETALR